jgi:cell division initiation protein
MSYTPVELRHVRVGRSLFGYNRSMVEQVIEEVAQSFEATWRERGELADKVEALEKQLEQYRQREGLLTQTLVAAEQAASDVRERARREAETILLEAHSEARAIGREAHAERERLHVESRRIEAMLRAALGVIAESHDAPTAEEPRVAAVPVRPAEQVVAPEPTVEAKTPIHAMPPVPEVADPPLPPAAVEKALPAPPEDDLPGWPLEREDTAEFAPISVIEPDAIHEELAHEPDEEHDHPEQPRSARVLQRISGTGSRDFDWGE